MVSDQSTVYYCVHSNSIASTNSTGEVHPIGVCLSLTERKFYNHNQQVQEGLILPLTESAAKAMIESNTIGWYVSNIRSKNFRPVRVSKVPEGNVVTIATTTYFVEGTWDMSTSNRHYYNKYFNYNYRGCTKLRTFEEAKQVSTIINSTLAQQRKLVKNARQTLNEMVTLYSGQTYHY